MGSATFARSLQHFGRRSLVDLVALMGNYAGTAALLTAFDMQLEPNQSPLLPVACRVPVRRLRLYSVVMAGVGLPNNVRGGAAVRPAHLGRNI